jgi:hypothetical protein
MTEAPSALREPGQSLQSLGLAIDINPHTNPWLINPDASGAGQVENAGRSRAIKNVIDRAVLLVTNQTVKDADLQRRPKRDDAAERVEASYDKLQGASDALARYLALDGKDRREDLQDLIDALGANNPKGWDAKRWAKVIAADRKTLRDHADAKKWTSPKTGFLHLDKRLVKAMTGVGGLTWLGDDTIAVGRDIMHFDMRGVGPIHSIWDSAQGKATGLGNG